MAAARSDDLVVLGAGFCRTGTHSLRLALERLLGGPCYHMHYVFENPHHMEVWSAALRSDPGQDAWKAFLRDYRAAIDFPTVCFHRRLMEVYPRAKVVLTVRDARGWFHSFNKTIRPRLTCINEYPRDSFSYRHARMVLDLFERTIGPVDLCDEEKMVAAFERHVEAVKREVPPERLLVFEVSQGWGPLCRFLGLPEPEEPFPVTNTLAEFEAVFLEPK